MTARPSREDTLWFGAVLGSAAAAMLLVALLFAQAYLRARADAWPPLGVPRLPWVLPVVNLGVIIAVCFALRAAARSRSFDRLRRDRSYMDVMGHVAPSGPRSRESLDLKAVGACAFGVLFLVIDGLLWRTLLANGFTPSGTGAYGATFFALTFTHAALVVIGLFGLAGRVRSGRSRSARGLRLYWNVLAVGWLAIVLGGVL